MFILAGVIFSNIASYGYRLLIARNYGPQWYGVFSLAIMIVGLIVSLSSLGFPDSAGRFLPRYIEKNSFKKIKFLVKNLSLISLIINILAGIVLFLVSDSIAIKLFREPLLATPLKIFSILVPVWVLSNLFLSYIISLEKVAWHSFLTNVVPSLLRLAILVFLIIFAVGPHSIFISYLLGSLIALIVSTIIFYRYAKMPKDDGKLATQEKKLLMRQIIIYSWPLIFSALLTKIYYWTDSFMIGYLLDTTQVGIYNAATPIALLLTITPLLFLQLFVPIINREIIKGRKKMIKQMSQQVGKWIFLVNLPVLLFIFVFPGAIINVLFGQEYVAAANTLRILSLGAFISSLSFTSERLILMKGKSKTILINVLSTAIINLILNALLIPKYGITGAAIATAITWFILGFLLLIEGRYYLSIVPLRRKVARIALASILPFIALILVKDIVPHTFISLLLSSILFMLIYLALVFWTGCLDKYDLTLLRSLKKKIIPTSNPL